jgi:hypothetical protein
MAVERPDTGQQREVDGGHVPVAMIELDAFPHDLARQVA